MRTYTEQKQNLRALAEQEGTPGQLGIEVVAQILVQRDELIRDLKRVIEDDVRWRRIEGRQAQGFYRRWLEDALPNCQGCRSAHDYIVSLEVAANLIRPLDRLGSRVQPKPGEFAS